MRHSNDKNLIVLVVRTMPILICTQVHRKRETDSVVLTITMLEDTSVSPHYRT